MSRIDEGMGQRILAMAKTGASDRAIVAQLGAGAPSRATVARFLLRERGHVRSGRASPGKSRAAPESQPVALAGLPDADEANGPRGPARGALLARLDAADTCEAVAAAELELARHDDPSLAARLDVGDPPVTALLIAGHGVGLLTRPEDFADLARLVTAEPLLVVRGEGEAAAHHQKKWRDARDAEQSAAVELLKAALAIVETSDPPSYLKADAP